MANQISLNGGSGGIEPPPSGPPSGGGTPGSSTGSSTADAFPASENGGVFANNYFLFVPVQDVASGRCFIGFFDFSDLDDKTDDSNYQWRVEDVVPDATPTVNRIDITYLDLGLATLSVTVTGTNDLNQVVSQTVQQQIGNAIPTKRLLTVFVPFGLTCMRPQLSIDRGISRNGLGGPTLVTRAIMRGECEQDSQ